MRRAGGGAHPIRWAKKTVHEQWVWSSLRDRVGLLSSSAAKNAVPETRILLYLYMNKRETIHFGHLIPKFRIKE